MFQIIQSHSELKNFVGMDVDPVARKLGHFHIDSLMHPTLKASIVLKNFKYIKSVIADTQPELLDVGVDGILMDLGMSSMQVHFVIFTCNCFFFLVLFASLTYACIPTGKQS